MKKTITITEIANTSWKDHAIYTLEKRAIPSMVDGLKPSQRFILYSALKNAKDKFTKVAEIAGVIASYGYHHAETSAQDAATLMAATWKNNTPLLEGDGNFGTRLIQKASPARYIFAKVHDNFYNIFLDNHLTPPSDDEEIKIPKYYLPIIPFVLLNGVQGVATGFSTNILPYDIAEVTKLVKDHLNGKDISKKTLIPKYPHFKGKVEQNDKGGFDIVGLYELKGKTKLSITEVPYHSQYDREGYIKILDSLEENGQIVSYIEKCDENGFAFDVTLRRDFSGDIEKIFKLRKSVTENLTVIDHNNKLREYSNPIDLIKDFCNFRITYVQERIEQEKHELESTMSLIKAKMKFILLVINNKLSFKEKTKSQLKDELINLKFDINHIDPLLSMNFYHLTTDEIDKLATKYNELENRLDYCKSTTSKDEYLIDINKLLKHL